MVGSSLSVPFGLVEPFLYYLTLYFGLNFIFLLKRSYGSEMVYKCAWKRSIYIFSHHNHIWCKSVLERDLLYMLCSLDQLNKLIHLYVTKCHLYLMHMPSSRMQRKKGQFTSSKSALDEPGSSSADWNGNSGPEEQETSWGPLYLISSGF